MNLLKLYASLLRHGDWQYVLHHYWESRVVWWVLKLIPRELKKWVVVQAAVRGSTGGSPDQITYKEMYEVYK